MTERTADDYEPGTRFVVVEIPPEADDETAAKIAEHLFRYAGVLDGVYRLDLFAYMQHNAPPADVPRLPPATTHPEAARSCVELARWLVSLDDQDNADERRQVTLSAIIDTARHALRHTGHDDQGDDMTADEFDARMSAGTPVQWADDRWPPPEAFIG